jgi:small-conductance mechanosensitive channel
VVRLVILYFMNASPTVTSVAKPGARFVCFLAIALLASIIAAGPAAANATSDSTEETPAHQPDHPAPIPVSQLSTRSEEAAGLLRQMRDRPVPDERIETIEEKLPNALAGLQQLMDVTDAALTKAVSSRTLEDLDRWWQRARGQIEDWRSHVAQRALSIDRDTESLVELRLLWEVTLDDAVANGEQEVVLDAIRRTLDHIRREESRFDEHRAQMLNIAMRIAQAEDMIASAFDQLDAAKKKLRVRLYEFDTPPLWEALADPPPRTDHVSEIRTVFSKATISVRVFFHDYRNWLIVHAIALILLVVLMRSLNKRAKQLKLDDPDLAESINVVSRPFSSALLLALAAVLFFYQNPPRIVDEITTILCFIPLYRLLPRKAFKRLGRLMIWLICLHVFDRITDVLPYLSLLKRLLLLLLTTVTFAVVLRAIKEDATKHAFGMRSLRVAERVAAFLLVVSFLANVLGNLSLADMIVSAVIASAYSALVLYAIYLVVDAVLRLGIGTRFARTLRMVRRNGDLIRRQFMMVLRFGLKVLWMALALYWLQILPVAVELVGRIVNAKARFGDISISLGGVLAFAVTVWAAFMISRIIRFILEEDVYPRMALPRGVPNAVSTGLHYVLLLVAFILAVAATGADLSKFAILAGAFGVGIGFGLQSVVNNFISGLILIAERPIMPGDTIEFGNRIGDVKRIGLRASIIRTWSGAEVIVPNGNLISSEVINWTLSDKQRRLDVPVGVAYGSPVKQVMEILVNLATQHADVMDNPAPRSLFMGFGDSSLDFELRCWTGNFENFRRISSDLVVGIEAALNEAGIVIPFPQRDLHIKTVEVNAGRTMRGEPPIEPQRPPVAKETELPRVPKRSTAPPKSDTSSAPPEAEGGG